MTDLSWLDAIEARLAAATPGQWRCFNAFPLAGTYDMVGIERLGPDEGGGLFGSSDGDPGMDLYTTCANAEFVAMAGTDIARLVSALRRVEKLAADMRTWCSPHGIATTYADRLDAALTEEES